MGTLDRFSLVWCNTCGKTQPMSRNVMRADDKSEHDAADIVCAECKSIIATLHAPNARDWQRPPKHLIMRWQPRNWSA
jgi:hypothetical protein